MQHSLPQLDEAILYSVELQAIASERLRLEETLTPDEIARADRFLVPGIRERFVICRSVLRDILGKLLNCPAAEVRFRYEKWGKPQLQSPNASSFHFNVSHAEDRALIAIANCPIGVDLEVANPRINLRGIAAQVLSSREKQAWDAMPAKDRNACILPLWVSKEALLKALGLGIAEGLTQISFPLPIPASGTFAPVHLDPSLQIHLDDDGTCRSSSWIDANAWTMHTLDMDVDCVAALATRSMVQRVTRSKYVFD